MTPSNPTTVVAFPESEVSIRDAYLRGLPSAATRRVYGQVLTAFEDFLLNRDVAAATRRDVEAYRAHLEALGRSPATICKVLSALTGFFAFAVEEGTISRNPAGSARRPRVSDVSPRRALTATEVRALLAVVNTSTMIGLRDRALLMVLSVQGLRISEALGTQVEDLAEEAGQKVVTVHGKGGKVVRVPLAAATWASVTAWTTAAAITGPIFVGVKKGGAVVHGKAMTTQAAWCRVRHLAKKAGITRPISPHLFRHTAVTTALANGVPLHQAQDFARHADPRTTRRYDAHRMSLNNPAPHVIAGVLVGDQDGG